MTGPHKQEWDKARSNFRGPQNPLLEEVDEGGSMVEGVVKFKIHITAAARREGVPPVSPLVASDQMSEL